MMEEEVNPAEAGQYKSHDNMIMEYLPDGTRCIRFKPVAANETSNAMEQLLLAYYDALSNMLKEDKIVKIGSYRDARYMKK